MPTGAPGAMYSSALPMVTASTPIMGTGNYANPYITSVPYLSPTTALIGGTQLPDSLLRVTGTPTTLNNYTHHPAAFDNRTLVDNATTLKPVQYGVSWTPEVIQRMATLIFIMALTFFGNFIIIIVLSCSKYRKLNSRVNIFIINLAIGDLCVCCFTMSTEILFGIFGDAWVMGEVACKVIVYIQIVTLASTTFILTAMSFDRYMAICKPLKFGTTSSRARRMIIIAWAMAFTFASPQLFIFRLKASGIYPDGKIMYKCVSQGYTAWWQRELYFTSLTAYILVIPSVLISFCYINVVRVVWKQGKDISAKGASSSLRKTVGDKKAIPRAKIKTIKMTLSIIITFIGCWTPYFVVHLIHVWSHYKYKIPKSVYVFAETIALLNSALNPILYGCFNIKLKRGLLEVFCPDRLPDKRRCVRGFATGMTECVSLTEDHNFVTTAKRLTRACGDRNSSSSGSSHGRDEISRVVRGADSLSRYDAKKNNNTTTQAQQRNKIITESNKNSFLYKIRFVNPQEEDNKLRRALLDKEDPNREEIADYVTTI